MAQTGLPGAITSATYDAANELINWNGIALSYDNNGNTLFDGTNSYTWDARGQLTSISGGTDATFAYDAAGRRISRTIDGQTTNFSYDGDNGSQELSDGSVSANMLTGGTDEFFMRTDGNGSLVPITDDLGSVLGLTDSNGSIVTQYSYDPFGNTTAGGTPSNNRLQYTGRENDGTGLYYYRARYYNPCTGRYISEDPLGFEGSGPDLYAYVFDSPTNLTDPSGLQAVGHGSGTGGLGGRYTKPCTFSVGGPFAILAPKEQEAIQRVFASANVNVSFDLDPSSKTDFSIEFADLRSIRAYGYAGAGPRRVQIDSGAIIQAAAQANVANASPATAIGRIEAHELGHLFLGGGHSPAGIMRQGNEVGTRVFSDTIDFNGDLVFTPGQGVLIRKKCRSLHPGGH